MFWGYPQSLVDNEANAIEIASIMMTYREMEKKIIKRRTLARSPPRRPKPRLKAKTPKMRLVMKPVTP